MKWLKKPAGLFFFIQLLLIGCATLNVGEIRDLQKTAFDPPELKPGYEINDLRIDLIRQTFTENVNDSVTETKDTPYHPFGFNIGNGLFYDINGNLGFRLEFLLGFSADRNFEVHQVYRAKKKKGVIVYRFYNDTLKVNYMYGKNLHYRYHRVPDANGFAVMYKKRTKYSIAFTDTNAIYRENISKPRIIRQVSKDQYDLEIRKRKDHFRKTESGVLLKNEYSVNLSGDRLALEIRNPMRKRNNVLYTIVKSDNHLFVYNRKFSGIKIEMKKDNMLLYKNNILWTKFELIN